MNVHAVEYHRNGVAGDGFFVVQFTAGEDLSDGPRRLVGIVPTLDDDDDEGCMLLDLVMVVDFDNLDQPVRGEDLWGEQLRAVVRVAEADGSAYVHVGGDDE